MPTPFPGTSYWPNTYMQPQYTNAYYYNPMAYNMYAFFAMMQNMWGQMPYFPPIQTLSDNVTLRDVKLGTSATA